MSNTVVSKGIASSTDPRASDGPATNLAEKLFAVAGAVDTIAKTGTNKTQGYDFVEAAHVNRVIREEFLRLGILCVPSARNIQHFTETNGKSFITTVELTYEFINVESGETLLVEWVGAGADIGGEKGLYKAYTGGLKYLLLNLFLIPTGDDPEADASTEEEHPDAGRAPAPEIPLDRAALILEKAVAAKLATVAPVEDGTVSVTLEPVFKAKLASVGVSTGKIAHLNVDQAVDVEAWLTTEQLNG